MSRRGALILLMATLAGPAAAQDRASTTATEAQATPARAILFVGNSFTQGAHSALRNWRHESVKDLNHTRIGGMPALFAAFARQLGLRYEVSQETVGGKSLLFHLSERRPILDRTWDVVVLQEYSTLDRERPGDPTGYEAGVSGLGSLFRARNPSVAIYLMATWSRADLSRKPESRWYAQPIETMARDLRAVGDQVIARTPGLAGVLPVGEAWNRSFAAGVADPNPFDGVSRGQVNLWAYDDYHGSIAGYYLEALVTFAAIAHVDPRLLGRGEQAADELGIEPSVAAALQQVAYEQLAHEGAWDRDTVQVKEHRAPPRPTRGPVGRKPR